MKNVEPKSGRKRTRVIIIVIAIVILAPNIFPLFSAFNMYHFTNRTGSFRFTEYPMQNTNLPMMTRQWNGFKENEHPADSILYRTFTINPLHFWQWREYLLNPRYRYPYLDTDKVFGTPGKPTYP